MKTWVMGMFLLMFVVSFCSVIRNLSSDSPSRADSYNVNVQQFVSAEKGLDLKAVGALMNKAKDPEEFERLLNDKESQVNNLDLNQDGLTDYIKVTEFQEGNVRGFTLTTELGPSEVQEIAIIKVEKAPEGNSDDVKVEVSGNESIYGGNEHHYYHGSSSGFGTGFLMGYLLSSHGSSYRSPYGYSSYPSRYHPYKTVPYESYQNKIEKNYQTQSFKKSSSPQVATPSSVPFKGRNASSVKAPLKNPTASQKSFQTRSPSREVKKGGFGRGSSVRGTRSRSSGSYSRGK